MLSTDDANPSLDLSCSCSSSQLIKSSDSNNICGDAKASSHGNNQVKIDLSDSSFDDNVKPISNFSIRDYVFSTRGKEFKTHWPFSPKKLQLCLRHGVKNVLPPFETLESVRNHHPFLEIPVEKSSSNIDPDHLKISCSSNNLLTVSSSNDRPKIVASNLEYIESVIAAEEDEEYRSTTISQSCSDNICSMPASNKVATSNALNKKCNLVVKLSSFAEPKSTKELMKTPVIVDTMANSKVCPVCKTFSSSSNTTLNAHIDQCLSGGPTSNCMTNSKMIKHRIKPRKTRMMVDIYATALHCTLEDLDRRNGTNWASGSGPAQCLEANPSIQAKDTNDEKNYAFSSVKVADKDMEGAVYVDSTGTKLRILSKFNDLPSNGNAVDDSSTVKLVKGDQRNKFLSSKKKCLPQNHKLLKSSSHDKNPDHSHKITDGEQRYVSSKKGCKNLDLKQHFDPCDRVRSGDFGLVKQWVGSKRTLLRKKKKNNLEHENHRISKAVKSLRVTQSQQRDNLVKETIDSCSPHPVKIPLLSAESLKRKNVSFHSRDEHIEQPRMKKRKELIYHVKKSDVVPSMSKDPEKDDSSVLERLEDPRNGTEDHVSSSTDEETGINVRSRLKAGVSCKRSRMPTHPKFSPGNKDLRSHQNSSSDHKMLFRSEKFSSLKTNMPSVKRSSASESKKSGVDLKKRKLRYVSESDEEPIVMFRSDDGRKDNIFETFGENASQSEGLSNKSSHDGFNMSLLKVQKNRLENVNSHKEGGGLLSKGLIKPLKYNNRSIGRVTETCVDGDNIAAGTFNAYDVVKEVRNHEERTCEPKDCTVVEGETFMALDRSPDSALPPYTECVSQHYAKECDEITQPGLVLHDNEETIPTDNVNDLVIPNCCNEDMGIDANEGHGNYYVDIDPIPIPGPPGSFLPSPRHMGSDELQGNSSLTTSRIHSSEDEHEVVCTNSSDSPISAATSIISNSIADGSKSAFSMDRSIQTSGVQDNTQSDDALEAKIGGVVENFTCFEFDRAGPERKEELDESRTNLMSPRSFNNSQPCCCSKKEGVFQTSESGYQESQLLKRRNMSSIPLFPVNEPVSEHGKVEESSSILHGNGLASHSYYETPSPSTPNPVFRLMGKNLMVVNKEEDLSPQTRPLQAIANEHHHVLQDFNSEFSKANIHNLQVSSFSNILDQGPPMLDNAQLFNPAQNIGFGSSKVLRMNDGFRNQELFSQRSFNGNHASSFEGLGYSGDFSTPTPDRTKSNIEINVPRIYAAKKVQTRVPTRPKEVIVIDDLTEHDGMNLSDNSSALRTESRNGNTFYIYQTQNYPICNGTQRVHSTYAQVPYSIGMHENVEKWNYTSRSLSVLNPNSFTASSSISGQPRSSLYFSSGIPLHKKFL